jgi:peroxiredoxin
MPYARNLYILVLLIFFAACGSNLSPSGDDKREPVDPGTTGPGVGQNAPDFSVPDIDGNTVSKASALSSKKGVVLYFTMWCPVCDAHMSHMLDNTVRSFPDIGFYAVDYVSSSVSGARSSAAASGFVGTPFTILSDLEHQMLSGYEATMGTTVVIDSDGIIQMNEDYKDGARLKEVLSGLQ